MRVGFTSLHRIRDPEAHVDMHYVLQPRPLTKGARCSSVFDNPLLLLAVVLAHADVVQAMLLPPKSTSTTPSPTESSTTPLMSKTTPPPSTPRPIPCSPGDCYWCFDKNENGCSETVSTALAWFHGPALSSSVLLIILGVSGLVLVAGLVAMCFFRNRKRKIVFGMKTVLFLIFFLFDFVWMGARFHWLLNSEDANFRTRMTSKEGEYIWISPKFTYSNVSQLIELGCDDDVMYVCVFVKIYNM